MELVINHNLQTLKSRVIPLYEECFGELPEQENQNFEEVQQKLEFNFLPGAPEKSSNKIVELRSETPKEKRRVKVAKRNFSRN